MLSLNDIQEILAIGFFNNDFTIAGIVIYIGILIGIFALTKNGFQALIIALPVTFIFSVLGILSTDLTMLLIIVVVLGLALSTGKVWKK